MISKRDFIAQIRRNLKRDQATIKRLTLYSERRRKIGGRLSREDASQLVGARNQAKYALRELKRLSVPGSTVIHPR